MHSDLIANPGSVFFDLGASTGLFSIYAAVKARARVVAFEPEAQNYATMELNHYLNRDRISHPLLPEGRSALAVGAKLAGKGIETRRWYCPTLERHRAFCEYPIAGELRVSAILNERLLAIPFHVFLSDRDIESVSGELARAIL